MDITVEVTDHSAEVLAELEEKVKSALEACGMEAENYAKRDTPVDTGRLRNSITYATTNSQGAGSGEDSTPHATPEKGTVYIGTNVTYAQFVELRDSRHTTGKAHFIRDAIADHTDKYKEIINTALK